MKTTATQKIVLLLFGLFLGVLLLEVGLRIGGYVYLSRQESFNRRSQEKEDAYVILCLGESTTACGGEYSYPRQLEEVLNERGAGTRFVVVNKGVVATNSGAVLSDLAGNLREYRPDMVIAMMGINDRKDTLVFDDIRGFRVGLFLRSFRVYKLARLLWEHTSYIFRERRLARLLKKTPAGSVARTEAVDRKRQGAGNGAGEFNLSDGEVYLEWGDWYFEQDRFEAALTLYEEAIKVEPNNSAAYVKAAACFRELGKEKEFDQMVDEALEVAPGYFRAYVELGNRHRDRNEWEEAEEIYAKAAELAPFQAETYLEWGKKYQAQKRTGQAEKMYKKAISLNPGDYLTHALLGSCYRENLRYEEAEREFKKAIGFGSGDIWLYTDLERCYRRSGRVDEADKIRDKENFYKRAIELHPFKFRLYNGLANMYISQDRWEEATALLEELEKVCQKAIEANPEAWWLYSELGECYENLAKWDQAEEAYQKALVVRPGVHWLYSKLGNCYRAQGKYEEAENRYRKAMEIEPDNPTAYVELGKCYRVQEKHKLAKEIYRKVLEANYCCPPVLAEIAFYLQNRDEEEMAGRFFSKIEAHRTRFYEQITTKNYRKLREIAEENGIRLVCVQYPVLDVQPLIRMFPDKKEVVFVDNEKIFKEAIKREGYDEYFSDRFGGDFGHCTPKGNRMLANNIADAILQGRGFKDAVH